jgi:hypothetical protein
MALLRVFSCGAGKARLDARPTQSQILELFPWRQPALSRSLSLTLFVAT